jgi:hypothetical protein
MVQVLNDNPYITIEMGAHTDRVGGDEYNLKLSDRRAKSVVDYLISAGIDSARLQSHGYGRSMPKVVTKRIARLYPQFNEGDTLSEPFVMALSKEDRAAADQINRRTEFQVLTTNYYRTFDSSIQQPGEELAEGKEGEKQNKKDVLEGIDTKDMSADEITKLRAEKEAEMKMIEQKEREKAAAEGKEADPEGKYSGENGKQPPKLDGGSMGSSTRGGTGTSTRGGNTGGGNTGSGNTGGGSRKSNDPNATKRH